METITLIISVIGLAVSLVALFTALQALKNKKR
ncbi:hypothetical protein PAV_5c04650 [Paenibacillus alvei DSM 29]|nr:hypothetical protein PAV_5c04650 [Paenibacillus alvei DSM 29]